MWSFLVLFFGAFLYGAWAMWNASLLPHPAQVRGERKAEEMIVHHMAAKRVCEDKTKVGCTPGQPVLTTNQIPAGFMKSEQWASRVEQDNTGTWLETYLAQPTDNPEQFAWALAKFQGKTLRVGAWGSNKCNTAAMTITTPCLRQRLS